MTDFRSYVPWKGRNLMIRSPLGSLFRYRVKEAVVEVPEIGLKNRVHAYAGQAKRNQMV